MSNNIRNYVAPLGSPNSAREITLSGVFKIGSSGAISSQTGALNSGVTVTQDTTSSAVGRYLLTFDRTTYSNLKSKHVSVRGVAAGSAFPTTTGIVPFFRDYTGTLPETSALSVQLVRPDTMADADGASGTEVSFIVVLSN